MKIFPGYDQFSPTLKCSPLVGDCMRHLIDSQFVTAWHDSAPPIFSGDIVRLHIRYPDFVATIIKQLRVSRAGTWWGHCSDGTFPLGTLVQPFAIEKIVSLDTKPLINTPSLEDYLRTKAPPETVAYFAELARDAVLEWETSGHVDGVRFPGLNRINFFSEDGCTRNPDYVPPNPWVIA